ncbi:MAG: aspartate carbamoyltransferase regulatory subunit [Desulfurococcaceae archaeon]|nr:MAG: aspartate carbamoyltransferase regulatory subunit [Desulfurococcaceae archaeon]
MILMEEHLLVRKIDMGTVIDHIPPWRAGDVLKLLDLEGLRRSDISLVILHNVPSKKYGRKDIIKLYRHFISNEEADLVCLVFPTSTINYIKDWRVEKYKPKIPERIVGRIKCPEVTCITNNPRENIRTRFRVLSRYRIVQCEYCDTIVELERIADLVGKKSE